MFNRSIVTIIIALLWACPAFAGDWLAVMDVTPDGRIAKYQDYDTEAEAQAHVDRVMGDYPDAYVAQRPAGDREQPMFWKLDPAQKTITLDVPVEPIKAKVKAYADKLIESEAPAERVDAMLARAARLNAEAGIKKRALTASEQAEVDQLIAIDDWRMAVREAARAAITGIGIMTEKEKMDFDPAVDVAWPAPPGE